MDGSATSGLNADRRRIDEPTLDLPTVPPEGEAGGLTDAVGGGESYGFAERAGFGGPAVSSAVAGDGEPGGHSPAQDGGAASGALREPTGGWPRIGDYWPDAPHRMGPPAEYDPGSEASSGTGEHYEPSGTGAPYQPSGTAEPYQPPGPGEHFKPSGTGEYYNSGVGPPSYPQDPTPTRLFAPPPPPRRPWLRVLLSALGALVFLGGSVITLARLVAGPDEPDPSVPAARAPKDVTGAQGVPSPPVSVEPAPSTTAPTSAPATSAVALPFESGTFELASNVIELNLTVVDLGSEPFQVSTPEGSGLKPKATVDGDDVRLVAQAADQGTGRLDVRLNERISWALKMTGGVRNATFALAGADLRRIELLGGATRVEMVLPSRNDALPIRMDGGVNTWTITTAREVPVRAQLRRGGGEVVLNGRRTRGVDNNTTLRARVDGDDDGGLEIDAVAGLGTLTVSPADGAA